MTSLRFLKPKIIRTEIFTQRELAVKQLLAVYSLKRDTREDAYKPSEISWAIISAASTGSAASRIGLPITR